MTVYKMLTGMRPFDPPPWARKKSVVALLRRQTEFEKLQAGVSGSEMIFGGGYGSDDKVVGRKATFCYSAM